jgi:hypothetical protein
VLRVSELEMRSERFIFLLVFCFGTFVCPLGAAISAEKTEYLRCLPHLQVWVRIIDKYQWLGNAGGKLNNAVVHWSGCVVPMHGMVEGNSSISRECGTRSLRTIEGL